MSSKTKDCAFAVLLILFGGVVLHESFKIVARATKPPYNITDFSISPGMLPTVIGFGLVVFSVLLLLKTLKGEERPLAALAGNVGAAASGVARALGDASVRNMLIGVVIMAVYTFFIVGSVPFWMGAGLYLLAIMLFLRAGKVWVIVLSSALSIAAIILLFEIFFKTTLP